MRAKFAFTRGRRAEGARLNGEMTAMLRQRGAASQQPLTDSVIFILIDAAQGGDRARVSARLDALMNAIPLASLPESDRPYEMLGTTYAALGRVDRARAQLEQVAQLRDTILRRTFQPSVHTIQGEIALAENRPDDALKEFRRADSLADGPVNSDAGWVLFQTGRAFDAGNQPDSAIAMFEQYLRSNDAFSRMIDDEVALPIIQRRLGELYDAKGDRARAVSHYSAFVKLWKNADPELQPQVADVRKRIARLGGSTN